jgi:hypothetical protein
LAFSRGANNLFWCRCILSRLFFDLPICLWMCHRCKLQFDPHTLIIVFEIFGREVRAVIYDDTMRYSKAEYYRLDEVDCYCGILNGWWCGVDVDDRPVGNPKRRCDEHSSKSSLSYETKVKSNQ